MKERLVYGAKSTCYGLVNSCQFVVNALRAQGIEAEVQQVPDYNHIDRVVHKYRPTHCFVEAIWVVPEKFRELAKLHPKVNWIVRIHSMIPFLVIEGMCFDWMNAYLKLASEGIKISLSCNNDKLLEDLRVVYDNVSYTPNIYNPQHVAEPFELSIDKSPDVLNIGCFGALRPLKNHAQQALWAIKFADEHNKTLHFHVNVSDHETNETTPVLKNLDNIFKGKKHKYFKHNWLPHPKFLYLVQQMDINMQISFTETFNIVAADSVQVGVPIVVSKEIDFVDESCRVNPSSPDDVFRALELCLFRGKRLAARNKKLLSQSAKDSLTQWESFLKLT